MEGKPITEYVNAANEAGIKKAYKFVPKGGESSAEVRERAKELLKVCIQKNIQLELYVDIKRIIKQPTYYDYENFSFVEIVFGGTTMGKG